MTEPDIRKIEKRHISRPYPDHDCFKINWTFCINNQSLGQKKNLSPESKNLARKNGFYEKEYIRMDKFKMLIDKKEGIIKKLYLIIISLYLQCFQ